MVQVSVWKWDRNVVGDNTFFQKLVQRSLEMCSNMSFLSHLLIIGTYLMTLQQLSSTIWLHCRLWFEGTGLIPDRYYSLSPRIKDLTLAISRKPKDFACYVLWSLMAWVWISPLADGFVSSSPYRCHEWLSQWELYQEVLMLFSEAFKAAFNTFEQTWPWLTFEWQLRKFFIA